MSLGTVLNNRRSVLTLFGLCLSAIFDIWWSYLLVVKTTILLLYKNDKPFLFEVWNR